MPSVSGLLQRSGEFKERPRKRYDDYLCVLSSLSEPIRFWVLVGSRMGIADIPPTPPLSRRLLMGLLMGPVAGSLGWSEAPNWAGCKGWCCWL